MRMHGAAWIAAAALAASSGLAVAQTIKIGIINTYSGPLAAQGDQLDKGFKLYLKLNGDKLPPGVKVEPIYRDDTGPNPDTAKRLAQELIIRDKVQFLTGTVWTPNAAAIAPLTAEAKVPFISANAAGVNIPYASPYFARVSFTLWQSAYPLGQWAAKKYKRVYTAVSDFSPGHEAEEAFITGFKAGGGEIVGSVRIPLANPDFVPYMQRIKDSKPDALFAFNPAGKQATAQMKAYSDLGLAKDGIKYIGTGDITTGVHGTVPVVVHSVGRRSVGLIVQRIVDIATADQELDTSQRSAAIRGRTLVGGRVIDIVDIRELARACGISFVSEPAVEVKR
jgi:branched-chain amino acid transport system substrate-binding protein